jgi:hypothetical protein
MSDKLLEAVAVVFYVGIALFSLYYGLQATTFEPKPACSVAEISPDFSHQDREKCRQIRGHKL